MDLVLVKLAGNLLSAVALGLVLLPRLAGMGRQRFDRLAAFVLCIRWAVGVLLIANVSRRAIDDRPFTLDELTRFVEIARLGNVWLIGQGVLSAGVLLVAAAAFGPSGRARDLCGVLGALVVACVAPLAGHMLDDVCRSGSADFFHCTRPRRFSGWAASVPLRRLAGSAPRTNPGTRINWFAASRVWRS